jgi:hypothetical protein
VFQHKNNCSRGGGPIIELMYEQLRRYLMVCGECSANTCANVWDDGNLALLPVDQWHHLVLTSDGVSVVKMYANGVLVSTINDADASYSYGVQPFSIGKHQDDPDVYYLNGKVDDVGYWNRALSADEIEQLYESSSRFIIRATK